MLGRAAFGDPWVFRRLRAAWAGGVALPPPTAEERLRAGLHHLDMMVVAVGAEAAAREMRKHVAWYIKGLPNSARVREQVNHTRAVDEMKALLTGYLDELIESGATCADGVPPACGAAGAGAFAPGAARELQDASG